MHQRVGGGVPTFWLARIFFKCALLQDILTVVIVKDDLGARATRQHGLIACQLDAFDLDHIKVFARDPFHQTCGKLRRPQAPGHVWQSRCRKLTQALRGAALRHTKCSHLRTRRAECWMNLVWMIVKRQQPHFVLARHPLDQAPVAHGCALTWRIWQLRREKKNFHFV